MMSDDRNHDDGKACTTPWLRTAWDASPLPAGVRNRLFHVDAALTGMRSIHRLLMEHALGKADQQDSGREYSGICPVEVEGLRYALMELDLRTHDLLEELREPSEGLRQHMVGQ